ncbi:MAG: PGF-pre-PGF domain-containing protein [Candidatus Methanoperedens sp.]
MSTRSTRSILVMLALISILIAMMSPVMADDTGIKIKIKPSSTIVNSTDDSYSATMTVAPHGGGFFFLNVTIPAGYNFSLPAAGKTVANYTMFNKTSHSNQVIINITSNNPVTETVDVRFSTDYGQNYSTSTNQPITNIVVGGSSLKLIKPSTNPGYLNLSLGGTGGPVLENDIVTVILANGTLKNPGIPGDYIWSLEAKNTPSGTAITSSDVVKIKAGDSEVVIEPLLDNNTPVEASLPLPAGNLTVNITTIPGVVVTNLVMTLRNFTDDPIPEETAGAPGPGFMWIGIDVPALQGVTFTARVSVNYSSVLSKLTIPEANLKLYHFNVTSSTWEAGSNNTVDTVNKIVSADFNSFSTFAIMGAAAAAGGGGDGGGSGGGGVATSEPFDNIAMSETHDTSLIANTPVTYLFKAPEIGIYEIAVTGKENENDIALRVEALKGTSKLVTASPPGTVYKSVNIWAGSQRIKEAIIRFKVNNTWIDGNNVVAISEVKLIHWDGSKWVQLETSEIAKDSITTSYEAKTDSFSEFAISSIKGVELPTGVQTPAESVTTTVTPVNTIVPEATKKTPGFGAITAIIAIVLLVSFIKKRR